MARSLPLTAAKKVQRSEWNNKQWNVTPHVFQLALLEHTQHLLSQKSPKCIQTTKKNLTGSRNYTLKIIIRNLCIYFCRKYSVISKTYLVSADSTTGSQPASIISSSSDDKSPNSDPESTTYSLSHINSCVSSSVFHGLGCFEAIEARKSHSISLNRNTRLHNNR